MCKYLGGILSKNTKGAVSSWTSAGFITSFQFCNKTQVANKSASCLAACTDFLVTVCKYSEVACMKAATHKEFPQKKEKKKERGWRESRPGSALRNKNGFHASHVWGPQCWSHVRSFMILLLTGVLFLFYYITQTVLCHFTQFLIHSCKWLYYIPIKHKISCHLAWRCLFNVHHDTSVTGCGCSHMQAKPVFRWKHMTICKDKAWHSESCHWINLWV